MLTHEHAQFSVEEPVEGVDRRKAVSLPGSSLLCTEFSDITIFRLMCVLRVLLSQASTAASGGLLASLNDLLRRAGEAIPSLKMEKVELRSIVASVAPVGRPQSLCG
jgi:hypothetical protein